MGKCRFQSRINKSTHKFAQHENHENRKLHKEVETSIWNHRTRSVRGRELDFNAVEPSQRSRNDKPSENFQNSEISTKITMHNPTLAYLKLCSSNLWDHIRFKDWLFGIRTRDWRSNIEIRWLDPKGIKKKTNETNILSPDGSFLQNVAGREKYCLDTAV